MKNNNLMGSNVDKHARQEIKMEVFICHMCGEKVKYSEKEKHQLSNCSTLVKKEKMRRHTLPSNLHNTPNLNVKTKSRLPLLKEEDLVGFVYSPEVLEETQKTEETIRQYQEINKVIKEFCLENELNYNEIPFDKKLIALKGNLNKIKIDWRLGYCTLNINRTHNLLEDSINQMAKIDLFKELKINFIGEVSHDAGGLIREWFTVIIREILSPNLGLFERANTDNFSFKIKSNLEVNEKNLNYFRFLGSLLAKALLEGVAINTCFNMLIYKMILDEKIKIDHLLFYDQELYSSLTNLQKNKDCIEDLEIYFDIQFKNSEDKIITEELIPKGSNIKVTRHNLDDYINKRIDYIIHKDRTFINEIKNGLLSIIPEHFIYVFNSNELFQIINGKPEIDVNDWKSNTTYTEPYCEQYYLIEWFWEVLSTYSQEELSKFLIFCTGSSRTPITGFKELESNRGNISKFCINFTEFQSKEKINYIRAHTCFNRIDLPDYPSKDILEEAMKYIIQNEILGFGID